MEINKLPNVNKHWIKNGYLNIELKTGDWIRLNFNNIQALKEQLTLTDVGGSFSAEDMEEAYNDGAGINKPREFDINNYR